jgi:hypothetical protein
MANVHVNSDYYIKSIHAESNNDANGVSMVTQYHVRLRRLPESQYLSDTHVCIENPEDDSLVEWSNFPNGLSNDDFLANIVPMVNTAVAAITSDTPDLGLVDVSSFNKIF